MKRPDITATRRNIARMECQMGMCGHWLDGKWTSPRAMADHLRNTPPPDPCSKVRR